jgi:hypothetical protein
MTRCVCEREGKGATMLLCVTCKLIFTIPFAQYVITSARYDAGSCKLQATL